MAQVELQFLNTSYHFARYIDKLTSEPKMTFNLAGVLSIIIFYIIILIVGIWAGRKKKSNGEGDEFEQEEVMLAGRNIGLFVGIFTMTGKLRMAST